MENELDAYIGGFHLDALTSGLPLNVDLDTTGVAWSLQPSPPRPWQCSLPSPPLPSTRTLAGLRPSHVDAHQV
jgi:hypothetical protein